MNYYLLGVLLIILSMGLLAYRYVKLIDEYEKLRKDYKILENRFDDLKLYYYGVESEKQGIKILYEDEIKSIKKMDIKDFVIWRGQK